MDLAPNVKSYLTKKYRDINSKGSYSGIDNFYRAIKKDSKLNVTKKQIKTFLSSQEYYTLLKKINRKYKRNKVIVPYIGYLIDLDTAHLTQYSNDNKGYGYILAGIDCFSKVAHCKALKTLKTSEVVPQLESLLNKFHIKENVRSDQGREFNNVQTKKLLQRLSVNHYFANNTETKANIVERFFRTLKSIIFRYMLANNTHEWVDNLDSFVDIYNNNYHSSIRQSPSSVNKSDEYKIWKLLHKNQTNKKKAKFRFTLNDTVRLALVKTPFQRDYDEKWTREYYHITRRIMKDNQPVYELKDIQNDPIDGTYYEDELQKIETDDADNSYIIDKILKKRRGRSLVTWLGWSRKHATWVDNSEIKYFSNKNR